MSNTSFPPEAFDGSTHKSVPTTDSERFISMDVLRGVALLGILLMNIQSFAMVDVAYLNPTAFGKLQGGDYCVWLLCHVFADQKFMTIFSMLFGAGIVVMAGRHDARGRPPAAFHYRRMGWLMVIGLLHAYLVWYGDILVAYSLCGAVVFVFRKLPCWLLIVIGMLSISVASTLSLLCGLSMPYWPDELIQGLEEEEWSPTAEKIEQEIATYRGSWFDQMPHRAELAFYMETFGFLFFFGLARWRFNADWYGSLPVGCANCKTVLCFLCYANRRGRLHRYPADLVWRTS